MLGHYFHRIILIYSATPCEQCCARDYNYGSSARRLQELHTWTHSQSPSEPERGYAMHWRPSQRWRPAVYIGTLYTIRVRMTVVHVELKPFALQWGLRMLYVASYAWLSEEEESEYSKRAQTVDLAHLPRTPAWPLRSHNAIHVYLWPYSGLLSRGEVIWDEPTHISMRAPDTTGVVPNGSHYRDSRYSFWITALVWMLNSM